MAKITTLYTNIHPLSQCLHVQPLVRIFLSKIVNVIGIGGRLDAKSLHIQSCNITKNGSVRIRVVRVRIDVPLW